MTEESRHLLVEAIYPFQGKNNDELWFKKGDVITVTQKEDGGWWEGTLGEKTGWFPSNYVKEYHVQGDKASSSPSRNAALALSPAQQKAYRDVVVRDILDSEHAHVAELQTLSSNFLQPLEKAQLMTRDEYNQLVSNMAEVVSCHQGLLAALEECAALPTNEQRVGHIFLTSASRLEQVHQAYCAAHPRAVCVLDKHRDELNSWMEAAGATVPGILVLTTGLSKPFRRLEKYAGMLQELERHIQEHDPDRGDTQRSVSVFKDISSSCSAVRRQKELELEVVTGGVRGWEGEDLRTLGDIVHMGSVAVGPDHRDRYLVLFPHTLLMLSVSHRMSAFIYEGKLPLTGITISKLESTDNYKNAFEIVGPMIERIVAVCQSREDQQRWVDVIRQQIRAMHINPRSPSPPRVEATSPQLKAAAAAALGHVSVAGSPYARLTSFFSQLVASGVITRPLLKKLLYRQFSQDYENIGIVGVKIRRNHRVECVIFPQPMSLAKLRASQRMQRASLVCIPSGSDSSGSIPAASLCRVARQDAVDVDEASCQGSEGSTASSPFGLLLYYAPQCSIEAMSITNRAPDISNESSFETPPGHQPFPTAVCQDLTHLGSSTETGASAEPDAVALVRHSVPPVSPHRVHAAPPSLTISSTLELDSKALPFAEIAFDVCDTDSDSDSPEPRSYCSQLKLDSICCPSEPKVPPSNTWVEELPPPLSGRSSDSGLADITSPDPVTVTSATCLLHSNAHANSSVMASTPATSAQASMLTDSVEPSVYSSYVELATSPPWDPRDHRSRNIYRSGMYAHWGMKMRIPASVVYVNESKPVSHRHPPPTGKMVGRDLDLLSSVSV